MGPLKKLLLKIPDRRMRRAVGFVSTVLLSVLFGYVIETATKHWDPKALKGLEKLQGDWIGSVEQMTPLALATGYWGDIKEVASGRLTYQKPEPPKPIDRQTQARQDCAMSQFIQHETAKAACANTALQYHISESDCLLNNEKAGCSEYRTCLVKNSDTPPASGLSPSSLSPPCIGFGPAPNFDNVLNPAAAPSNTTITIWPPFIPLVALWHGATRLVSGGTTGAIFAMLQTALGFLVLATLSYSAEKKTMELGGFLASVAFIPLATVGLGSLVAFLLKWLMVGALMVLSGITGGVDSLIGFFAGLGGVGGLCWACVAEITKKGAEHVVVG